MSSCFGFECATPLSPDKSPFRKLAFVDSQFPKIAFFGSWPIPRMRGKWVGQDYSSSSTEFIWSTSRGYAGAWPTSQVASSIPVFSLPFISLIFLRTSEPITICEGGHLRCPVLLRPPLPSLKRGETREAALGSKTYSVLRDIILMSIMQT